MGCFSVFRRKKNSRSQITHNDQDIPITGNGKIYSSKELKKATMNFCPGNKLEQGFLRPFLPGKYYRFYNQRFLLSCTFRDFSRFHLL
ncbi:unnamed protein product [Urochloa humidicola]